MIEQFCHMPPSREFSLLQRCIRLAGRGFQAKNMPTNAATAKPKFRAISRATESTAILAAPRRA
jgi:hypothetical protein